MSILLNGEPVQWAYIGSTLSTLTAISIFYPGTSTNRVLLSTEQFSLLSVRGVTQTIYSDPSPTLILKTISTASSTTAFSTGQLMLAFAAEDTTWHDDGLGSMSGFTGVVPTIIQLSAGSTWLSGTGLITQPIMGPVRNPQWPLLSNNSNAST